MQDITRFFDRSSKKRDVSNNSNKNEASKEPTEGSLNTSTSSYIQYDLFSESLKDPKCVIIFLNYIKKIEKPISDILENTNELKEKQFKGKSHLQELSNAVDFITKNFDTYKKERKERQKKS